MEIERGMKYYEEFNNLGYLGDSLVLHSPFLLGTIFAELASADDCVHIPNVRDFPQGRLESEIDARFLLNKRDDLYFFYCKVPVIVYMLLSLILECKKITEGKQIYCS